MAIDNGATFVMTHQGAAVSPDVGKINLRDVNAKPKIDYPCEWSYKLIGRVEEALCEAALKALDGKEHTIARSRLSSKGSFVSVQLTVIVQSEEERLNLFDALRSHSAILHIL